jgi:hypothetical protein
MSLTRNAVEEVRHRRSYSWREPLLSFSWSETLRGSGSLLSPTQVPDWSF